ncbi:Tda3p NDAI_0F01080 [Naumovozyma dairenensis CBS 421]|uniref:FAD dependent oxidoreductase domain-containing protein n=1 Tax=Naumovozyma dairenensis (strain ATCC 10597 / BCRC 20456 / CBS 421 / NBRC 0211 / NRRL Y-12639) TaxID=1071378 RepID=G0WCB6_NAUDC|nr:hypothetical protein NDAI_0F01080 [Naumovozyma dairenensis CBS 421]CCD25427.1 hypothetical protein NDAI_0F01080 [Naumovozyma dairenensis CBS 421]
MSEEIKYLSRPSLKSEGKQKIIIIGAGIIGVCTAYYLTKHPNFNPEKYHIIILESREVAAGASGKAGGLLASWAFPNMIVPLSFQLHQELSDLYNGETNWDYRRLTTVSLEADVQDENIKFQEQRLNLLTREKELKNNFLRDSNSLSSILSSNDDIGRNNNNGNNNGEGRHRHRRHRHLKEGILEHGDSDDGDDSDDEFEEDSDEDSEDEDEDEKLYFNAANSMSGVISQSSVNVNKNKKYMKDNNHQYNANDDNMHNTLSARDRLSNSGSSINSILNPATTASTTTMSTTSITAPTAQDQYDIALPRDLDWIRRELVDNCSSLGNRDSTAQVHPYKFTRFILQRAMESDCIDLILGKVVDVKIDDSRNKATGIRYQPIKKMHEDASSDNIVDKENIVDIDGDGATKIIITTGPWTSELIKSCPISGLRAHSIIIKPNYPKNNGNPTQVSPYAIFTELKINNNEYFSPEIYARRDEVYVCGEGDTLVKIPDSTKAVAYNEDKCEELYHYVSKISTPLSDGHIIKQQACYLPVLNVATSSGPLIGETNVNNLYIASGHSCWGINNAPATERIMSEIILEGESKSADISLLNPKLYFDASAK